METGVGGTIGCAGKAACLVSRRVSAEVRVGQAGLGSVAVQSVDGAAIIVLRGEHDLATVPLVEDVLARARSAGPVVVDLTDAAFIDSSIISVLVRYSRPADSGHAWSQLAVVVPPEGVVRRILLLVSIDQVVPTFSCVSHATAAMRPADEFV
jgi:anti-anti-sigma factor